MSVSLYGSGQTVIQVVSATYSTQTSTSSSTFSSSGLTASITPQSTNSKILVLVQANCYNGGVGGMGLAIARGTSVVYNPSQSDGSGPYLIYSTSSIRGSYFINYLDSPSTTSATSYSLYFAARSTTAYINESGSPSNGSSSIILMEISGS